MIAMKAYCLAKLIVGAACMSSQYASAVKSGHAQGQSLGVSQLD